MQNQIQNTSQVPAVISQAIKDYTAKHKIPEEGLTIMGGKPYINYTGLIFKAKSLGLKSIKVEILKEATPADLSAKVKATVVLKDGSEYEDFGFGSTASIKMSTLHSADYINMTTITRAKNRALRSATGVGLVSAEEMEGQPSCHDTGQDNASKLLNKGKETKKAVEGEIIKSEPEKKETPKPEQKTEQQKSRKITIDEGILLLSAIEESKSKEADVLKFYKVKTIYEMTFDQAFDLSKKLKAKKEAEKENEAEIKKIEEQDKKDIQTTPSPAEKKLSPAMQKVQDARNKTQNEMKEDAKFVKMESDVCKIVNKLSGLNPVILSEEQLNLIKDANSGQFKGKDCPDYKGIFI